MSCDRISNPYLLVILSRCKVMGLPMHQTSRALATAILNIVDDIER
jgi:hypothetical protein